MNLFTELGTRFRKPKEDEASSSAKAIQKSAASNMEALRVAFLRLDVRLRLAVDSMRDTITARAADPLRGLYISDADVDVLLEETPIAEVARELLMRPAGALAPRLAHLSELFDLDAFEQEVILICLAPDVDVRYERLYGYLQDDVSRRRPTVDLILRLLSTDLEGQIEARGKLAARGRLFSSGILALADEASERAPLLSRQLRLDERIVDYLLGADAIDPRINTFVRCFEPDEPIEVLPANMAVVDGLARLLSQDTLDEFPGVLVYLHGQVESSRRVALRAACHTADCKLLVADLAGLLLLGPQQSAKTLTIVLREALLQDAALVFDAYDKLLTDEPDQHLETFKAQLKHEVSQRKGATIFSGDARWEPATWLPEVASLRVEMPTLALAERVGIWKSQLLGRIQPEQLADLAARYRLDPDSVLSVDNAAQLHARWAGEPGVALSDVQAAARAISAPPMAKLAKRVEPRYLWNDIILPPDGMAQLHEISARAKHQLRVLENWGFGGKYVGRRGLTALFAGAPGTGKTMAADIIAGELGLELYRIDLASIVSKYIGETEKNLDAIFHAADQGDAVLLFDEADALFGKRSDVKDAHDRYANVEIAYLLQRLETYNGVAVLTTNLRGNLDDAFLRRLDFVIEFPLPEEAERLKIWQLCMPPDAPVADDADLDFLARKFKLAGGHIRNIALTSAFLAADEGDAIGMRHLILATRREYQKLGKLMAEKDFEQYFPLLRDA